MRRNWARKWAYQLCVGNTVHQGLELDSRFDAEADAGGNWSFGVETDIEFDTESGAGCQTIVDLALVVLVVGDAVRAVRDSVITINGAAYKPCRWKVLQSLVHRNDDRRGRLPGLVEVDPEAPTEVARFSLSSSHHTDQEGMPVGWDVAVGRVGWL